MRLALKASLVAAALAILPTAAFAHIGDHSNMSLAEGLAHPFTGLDHMLAMALFIAMLVEFLLVERAGTSTFFLLLIIALVDVLVGFTVSVRSSQRQVEIQTEGPA